MTFPRRSRPFRCPCTCMCRGACKSVPYCDFNSHAARGQIPEETLRCRPDRRSRGRPALGLGAAHCQRVFRWRNAEFALRTVGRYAALGVFAPSAVDPRSGSYAGGQSWDRRGGEVYWRAFAMPALPGSRSAFRVSTRRICAHSVAFMTIRKPVGPLKSRHAISITSIWISCTACRSRA